MTAVEWLDEQIQERVIAQDVLARKLIIEITMEDYMRLKQEANKMFEQQIIDAHIDGQSLVSCKDEYAKQYYTSTYGSKGSETK